MFIKDFYPLKGFFHPGEELSFRLVFQAEAAGRAELHFGLYSFGNCLKVETLQIDHQKGEDNLRVELPADFAPSSGGYALCLKAGSQEYWTAFDVQQSWLDFPRYGFLSDFSAALQDPPQKIKDLLENLSKYHLNALQFYDWQYRHDQLLPPQDDYLDPLQRPLSLETVRRLIQAAHAVNLAAMPYLAVYGASIKFWRRHHEWGLYDEAGEPLLFEDFLGLMDPAAGSPWSVHLTEQCRQTLDALPFDGLHIDQYGDPKRAWNSKGQEIDLPAAFVDFIDAQKQAFQVPLIFNAVGNWPIEALAESQADLMYIEVWPPTPRFVDLQKIVENARRLSGEKPVVIPVYIPAGHKTSLLLADAVIAASGGTHLELGDDLKLLSDPYFPKSEGLTQDYLQDLRRYWDFITANQALLGPRAENIDLPVKLPAEVHCISRKSGNMLLLSFIRVSSEDCWTEAQPQRTVLNKLPLKINLPCEIESLFWASPDLPDWQWKPLDFQMKEKRLLCEMPQLQNWSLLFVKLANR